MIQVATGAGLAGARSAIDALLREGKHRVHLYYGLRDARDLPYRDELEAWADDVRLTLLVSSREPAAAKAREPGLGAAIARGQALARAARPGWFARRRPRHALAERLPKKGGKIYAQHAVALDHAVRLADAVLVACGRAELLLEIEPIVRAVCADCDELIQRRLFTNI